DEEGAEADEGEAHQMVERDALAEIEHREGGEHGEGDHLLHGLELGRRIDGVAPAVGRNGETILDEGDAPARHDHQPQRPVGELQMAVPGEGHEYVGADQQGDRRDGGGKPGHVGNYSGLMLSFLISGTMVASSLASIAASSCGVLDRVSAVRSAKRLMTAGSARTLTMAALSLASTSGGSLAGP